MKQFLKYTLATVVGVFLSFLFLGFLMFFTVLSLTSSKSKETLEVKNNSVIELNIDYDVAERTEDDFMQIFNPEGGSHQLGLDQILKLIESAKKDKNIKGIFLKTNLNNSGYATLQEIRNALKDFKSAGKFVYAYAPYFDEKNYYLSSIADSIFIEKSGNVLLNGLSANMVFYKDALSKIGVEMQYVKVGAYKGAIEAYTRSELSPENKEQIQRYVNNIYRNLLSSISENRKIDTSRLHSLFDNFDIKSPANAVQFGLIDKLTHVNSILKNLKNKLGVKKEDELELVKADKYFNTLKDEDKSKDKIALIYAIGDIVDGKGGDGSIGSLSMSKAIAKAREDKKIKAIVLRINSPGGSALASDIIMQEILLCKGVKPVIVSMGDVAASGGYYISAMADSIIAMPNTITGSIGVFGLFPNMQGLLKDKIGLNFESVKTGKYADFGRVDRPLSETDRFYLQSMVNRIYEDFTNVVEQGRKLDSVSVEKISQGKVWTSSDAIAYKLVDSYGGINDAIKIAAYKAKLKEYSVVELPKKEDPFSKLFNDKSNAMFDSKLKSELGVFYTYFNAFQSAVNNQGFQMRIPYYLNIQ
jgi:protease-4